MSLNALLKAPTGKPLGGVHIPRGTLHVEFIQKSYDQCRRSGLSNTLELYFRTHHPSLHGCLAVQTVLPQGVASGKLMPGDILLSINKIKIAQFVQLEDILDSNVHQSIHLQVLRNGQEHTLEPIQVHNLHELTPDKMIVWNGDVFHSISIHLARGYMHAPHGCVMIKSGNTFGIAGVPNMAKIVSINHCPVYSFDDLYNILGRLAQGARVPVRYYHLEKKDVELIKIIEVDRVYDTPKLWIRANCEWTVQPIPLQLPNVTRFPPNSSPWIPQLHALAKFTSISRILAIAQPSLVIVESRSGFGADGLAVNYSVGVGIVMDSLRGIVITDRMVVSTPLCRLSICVGNSVLISCRLLAMHPTNNSVWIQYDSQDPRAVSLKSIPIPTFLSTTMKGPPTEEVPSGDDYNDAAPSRCLDPCPMVNIGDSLYYVSVSVVTQICFALQSQVKSKGYFFFGEKYPPQHRTINFDQGISLDDNAIPGNAGVLINSDRCVLALWLGHRPNGAYMGTPINHFKSMLNCLQDQISITRQPCSLLSSEDLTSQQGMGSGLDAPTRPCTKSLSSCFLQLSSLKLPVVRTLDIECSEIHYWKALDFHLSHQRIQAAHTKSPEHYALVVIRRVVAGTVTSNVLREMDILIQIDDEIISSISDVETMQFEDQDETQQSHSTTKTARVLIFRDGDELTVTVPWVHLPFHPAVEALVWSGAVLQLPHRALRLHTRSIPNGLYVSALFTGSPAHRDGLSSCVFITHINHIPVHSIQSFISVLEETHPVVVKMGHLGWSAPELQTNATVHEPQAHSKHFRLTIVDLQQVTRVIHVEYVPYLFPTYIVTI
jgi:S1-C subfamily serine protease